MIINKKNKKQDGYAILFTVIIVSAISLIAIGISNTAYKQMILSSVAKDSYLAFYQSDTATECALYADNHLNMVLGAIGANWQCGIDAIGNTYNLSIPTPDISDPNNTVYDLAPADATSSNPCFSFNVEKSNLTGATIVTARGYNVCNANNLRKVEREIEVDY